MTDKDTITTISEIINDARELYFSNLAEDLDNDSPLYSLYSDIGEKIFIAIEDACYNMKNLTTDSSEV